MNSSNSSVVSATGDYAPSPNTCSQAVARASQLRVQALLKKLIASNSHEASTAKQQRLDTLRVLRRTLRETDYQLSWLTQVDFFETIERLLKQDVELNTDWRLINDSTQLLIEAIPKLQHEIEDQTIEQILANVIQNLGHRRSEVRRTSLLLINMYLNERPQHFKLTLNLFIDYGLANQANHQAQRGAILSLPLLMTEQVIEGQDLLPLIRCLCDLLVASNEQLFYSLYLALQRLHLTLGDQKFASYMRQSNSEATLLYKQTASRNNSLVSGPVDLPATESLRKSNKPIENESREDSQQPNQRNDNPTNESAKQVTFENGTGGSVIDQDDRRSDEESDQNEHEAQLVSGTSSRSSSVATSRLSIDQPDRRSNDRWLNEEAEATSEDGDSTVAYRPVRSTHLSQNSNNLNRPPLEHTSSVSSTCSSEANLVHPAHYMSPAALIGDPLANFEMIHHVDHSATGLAINDLGPVCCTPTIELGPGAENELKFGIFPRHLVTAALGSRYLTRLEALQEMMCIMRESPINHLAILMTYFDSFLEQFLARLVDAGTDYKVELIAIDMIETIVIKTKISTMQYARPIISLLMRTLADSRSIFRDNTIRVIHKMMSYLPPQHVIDAIFEHKHNKSALVREESVNRVTAAVLEFNRNEFNLTKLCYHILPMLADHSANVRLAALECIATLAHALGPERIGSLLTAAEAVQTGCDYDGLLDAIHARLTRHTLPRCNADGSIRYVIKPFLNLANVNFHQEHQAADVRWVLEAPSTHQHVAGHQNQNQMQGEAFQQHHHHRLGVYSPPDAAQRRRSSVNVSHFMGLGEDPSAEVHHLHHHQQRAKLQGHKHSRSQSYSKQNPEANGRQGSDQQTNSVSGDVQVAARRSSQTMRAGNSNANDRNFQRPIESHFNCEPNGFSSKFANERQSLDVRDDGSKDKSEVDKEKNSFKSEQNSVPERNESNGRRHSTLKHQTTGGDHNGHNMRLRRSNSQESTSSTDTNKVLFQFYLNKFRESLMDKSFTHSVLPSDSIIYTDTAQAYALSQHQSRQQQTSFDYDSDSVGQIPNSAQANKSKANSQGQKIQSQDESPDVNDRNTSRARRLSSVPDPSIVPESEGKSRKEMDTENSASSSNSESPLTIMEFNQSNRSSEGSTGSISRKNLSYMQSSVDEQAMNCKSQAISRQQTNESLGSNGNRRKSVSSSSHRPSINSTAHMNPKDTNETGGESEKFDQQVTSETKKSYRRRSLKRQMSNSTQDLNAECDEQDTQDRSENTNQQEIEQVDKIEGHNSNPTSVADDELDEDRATDRSGRGHTRRRPSVKRSDTNELKKGQINDTNDHESAGINSSRNETRQQEMRRRASRSQPPSGRLMNQRPELENNRDYEARPAKRAISVSPSLASSVNIRHILENVAEVEGPFQDPSLAMKVAMDAIDSPCWSTKVEGILAIVRLANFNQPLVASHLHEVIGRIANETSNLRSTVARSAIFTLGELSEKLKRLVEPELSTIVQALLNKSMENTSFIRDDIRRVLTQMVENVTSWRLANLLIAQGSSHKNVHVRRMASQFVWALVERMGAAKCLVGARDISAQLIPAASKFAQDNSPYTRYYGRLILARIMQHVAFERLMRKTLTPTLYRSTMGVIESIKRRGPGEPPSDN